MKPAEKGLNQVKSLRVDRSMYLESDTSNPLIYKQNPGAMAGALNFLIGAD
jgi:hypothetical protein